MSKQLVLSIAASVLAMAGYAMLSSQTSHSSLGSHGPRWSAEVSAPGLPALGQLIPVLQ